MISDEEISSILADNADVEALIAAAKQAGGRDNVSVILLTVCAAEQEADDTSDAAEAEADTTGDDSTDDEGGRDSDTSVIDRSSPMRNDQSIPKIDKTKR